MTVPPPAPVPVLKEVKHHIIELEWGEYLDRLAEVFKREDGKISVEVQSKPEAHEEWELVYAGYGRLAAVGNLEPESKYHFRLRFRNKHGPGQFSPILEVFTIKRPLTGEDIHKAIKMEDLFQLRKVLSAKEANIEAQDDLGFTPLQAACNRGLTSLADVLLEFGCNPDAESDASKTALMIAAFKNHTDVMEILLKAGANIEHKDKNGITALHVAVDGEKLESLGVLLKHNASTASRDNKLQWTPLHRCAGLKNNGNEKVAAILIHHKADVNAVDRDQKTPLMLAATNGHHKLVELLLDKGADLNMTNEMGHNAWALAESNDRRAVKRAIQDFMEKNKLYLESVNCQEKTLNFHNRMKKLHF